jgi:glutamate synthase (NADPH/NADH) small chain
MRRIRLMEEEGIKFVCNANVGENVEPMLLLKDFDAVVLCTGATLPRDLQVEGRALRGVHYAMDYLTGTTQWLLARAAAKTAAKAGGGRGGARNAGSGASAAASIDARDKDVVVIGGGDTGTDCVGSAMRQGCRSLTQFEIMPKPPLERAADNPWPEWPRVYRMDYGQEEAAARFGRDPRVYVTTVKKFVGDQNGAVKELVTVQVRWERNDKGQTVPVEVPGTERTQPAQLVLLAMGFLGPEQPLLRDMGIEVDARSNVAAEYDRYATNMKGVFAAGDCRRGQSLVVWAINEGRGAGREVDRYLMGSTTLP